MVTVPGKHAKIQVKQIIITLLLGGAGGYLFTHLHVPLPWLLGAILATSAGSLLRLPVAMPSSARTLFTGILGLLLGSRIIPSYFADISEWIVSAFAVGFFVIVSTAVGYWYLRQIGGYAKGDAFFGAVPGGLNDMTLIGGQMGADERVIALLHSCRLLLTVTLVPVFLMIFAGAYVTPTQANAVAVDLTAEDIALMAVAMVAGIAIANRLRLPGGALIGPLAVFGALTFFGIASAAPPGWLVALAQVVVGSVIGIRFRNIPLKTLTGTMSIALGATLLQLNFSLLFAILVNMMAGLPIADLILAFAPGGQAEMSLLGLSLGGDIAFITLHATLRANGAIAFAPLIYRYFIAEPTAFPKGPRR